MALAFHTIWLGSTPPLRALENQIHLLALFEAQLPLWPQLSAQGRPCIPLLWLDRRAWQQLSRASALPLTPCGADQVPEAWLACTDALFASPPQSSQTAPITCHHWLRIASPAGTHHHLPVLIVEEMLAALAQPWQDLQPTLAILQSLAVTDDGATFLERELALGDPATSALLEGPPLLDWLLAVCSHAQQHWRAHGLLCLASDLLRLLALIRLPGAYGDLGDVAGRLQALPTAASAGPDGFCAHHTVAIENDLILATDPLRLQAITVATGLWSARTIRAIAIRLQLVPAGVAPLELLQAVLPHLDRRLLPPPALQPLFQPPWIRLADFINLAYGAPQVFQPREALAAYAAGYRGKELLINDVGGFTGYQKAAHHLAPANASTWADLALQHGLVDYAPQLGWKTYGFGTIDRLIDLGQRLLADQPLEAWDTSGSHDSCPAWAELALIADGLGMSAARLEPLAVLCCRLHQLLGRAWFEPQQRHHWLAQVQQLCQTWDARPTPP
jgi:hypothetical protein